MDLYRDDDREYGLTFTKVDGLTRILDEFEEPHFLALFERLRGVDLWIIRLSGHKIMDLVFLMKKMGVWQRFQTRNFKVYFWSMDTHHLLNEELRAIQYFDGCFIAHPAYLKHFPQGMAHFLPCAITYTNYSGARVFANHFEAVRSRSKYLWKFGAAFNVYPNQRRNLDYLRLALDFRSKGEEFMFCRTLQSPGPDNAELVAFLSSTRAVVNFSMDKDINMRNFEGLASGAEVWSDEVPGLKEIFTIDSEDNISGGLKSLGMDFGSRSSARLIRIRGIQTTLEGFLKANTLESRLLWIASHLGLDSDHNLILEDRQFELETLLSVPHERHSLSWLLGNSCLPTLTLADLRGVYQFEGVLALMRGVSLSVLNFLITRPRKLFLSTRFGSSLRLSVQRVQRRGLIGLKPALRASKSFRQ